MTCFTAYSTMIRRFLDLIDIIVTFETGIVTGIAGRESRNRIKRHGTVMTELTKTIRNEEGSNNQEANRYDRDYYQQTFNLIWHMLSFY